MYEFKMYAKYKLNNKVFETTSLENSHFSTSFENDNEKIKVTVIPKCEIEFSEFKIDAKRALSENEVFFSNGYQAWTTSFECNKNTVVKGLFPLAKVWPKARELAGISGDYFFTDYSKKPGRFHSHTYTYFRTGENFELLGSLSERNGFTIFEYDASEERFSIIKDIDGLVIDKEYVVFDIAVINGSSDDAFDEYFKQMNISKPRIDHMSGYTSWYNYYQHIDEKIILRDLNGLDRAKDSVSVFQIDDGYENQVGDWLEKNDKLFPIGMKKIAEEIHKKGYKAGIWLAPFNAQKSSKIVAEHPEWLLKKPGTDELQTGCFAWHGAYTFDIYNEEYRKHIKHVFDVVLNDWGFDMVKLDFLYSQCITPRNGKTRGQIMAEGMDFLRELVGDKLFLGCGVPLGSAFGVVDACRISCDCDIKYGPKYFNILGINNEIPSVQNAINNSVFRRQLDGRAFLNDPDVFYLRNVNLKFTFEQKLLLAFINNLFGNVLFVSDNAEWYSDTEIKYLKKFFEINNLKIVSAFKTSEKDYEIKYIENDEQKTLKFDIKTGKSNVAELIKIDN